MIRVRSIQELLESGLSRVAIACGVFDGLHRGHCEIINALLKAAENDGASPVVLTFDPHPMKVVMPDRCPPLLCSTAHKLHMLEQMGIAATVTVDFNLDFATMQPEEFVHNILLIDGIEIDTICVGQHWRFGNKASGNAALLGDIGVEHGFQVMAVPEIEDVAGVISSTRIRKHLANGELDGVKALLGRPFSIYGRVAHGKGIATEELHYPTANIAADNEIFPPCGIYAARVALPGTGGLRKLNGVLYLGNAPTYVDTAPSKPFVEMHVFDFHEDIYDEFVEVELLDYIRGDQRFSSSEELRKQIQKDVQRAHEIHTSTDNGDS